MWANLERPPERRCYNIKRQGPWPVSLYLAKESSPILWPISSVDTNSLGMSPLYKYRHGKEQFNKVKLLQIKATIATTKTATMIMKIKQTCSSALKSVGLTNRRGEVWIEIPHSPLPGLGPNPAHEV